MYRAKWNDLNVAVKKIKHDINGNGNSNNDGNQVSLIVALLILVLCIISDGYMVCKYIMN